MLPALLCFSGPSWDLLSPVYVLLVPGSPALDMAYGNIKYLFLKGRSSSAVWNTMVISSFIIFKWIFIKSFIFYHPFTDETPCKNQWVFKVWINGLIWHLVFMWEQTALIGYSFSLRISSWQAPLLQTLSFIFVHYILWLFEQFFLCYLLSFAHCI